MRTYNKYVDIGKKYGKLVITNVKRVNTRAIAMCKCECGNTKDIMIQNLKSGATTSCGCSKITHNLSNHRLHGIWSNLKDRCYNKNSSAYRYYGAKGVTVHKEWLDSFITFYEWAITNGYKDSLQLDKDEICEAKGITPKIYSPSTCKWVTKHDNVSRANTRLYRDKELKCSLKLMLATQKLTLL